MFSFIIPAYNEEALLGPTIESLQAAIRACLPGEPYEMIVVDDASEDRTAEVARSHGAVVVPVNKRQIAAVRNAGARASRGDVLIFVDADTLVPPATLRAALEALRAGAVGGGSHVEVEDDVPFWGRVYFRLFTIAWRPLKLAAGCFVFARRDAFVDVGGFDERYYASEEIWISKALKTKGRFVIVREPVITSGRKARMHSAWQFLTLTATLLIKGPRAWQKRNGLELWYDGRREEAESRAPES